MTDPRGADVLEALDIIAASKGYRSHKERMQQKETKPVAKKWKKP